MKWEIGADGLTVLIKMNVKSVYGKEVSKKFGSRSLRKGEMTKNHEDQNHSTQEEHMQSGHTAPGHNTNAEGCIGTITAMSGLGGKAIDRLP